jgi:Cyclin
VDMLVELTGDVPPTPPVRSRAPSPGSTPSSRTPLPETPRKENPNHNNLAPPGSFPSTDEHIDGVVFVKTPIGSPEAHPHEPITVVGANAQPIYLQHGAIARKFYSKRPPPISTEEYLMRMHKYCPMSTAIYLATSTYITRMAVVDKIIPVTPRNVHRLLLAGLRVAMKALEDLSWPHARFSKVGGVSESELGRLEVTFCFLMDFSLKVDAAMLQREAVALCRPNARFGYRDVTIPGLMGSIELKLPNLADRERARQQGKTGAEKRKASSTLPSRPAIQMGPGIEVAMV